MSVQIYIYSLMISHKMKPVQCALSYLDAEDVKNNDENDLENLEISP